MSASLLSIGVNAYEANVTKRVGSNQYAYQLLCQLEKLTRNPVGEWSIDWTIYLPETPVGDMPPERERFHYRIVGPKKMWTQWRLPLALYFSGKPHNVFLSLGHYAPRFSPFPSAICILDLAYLKFPQFFLPKDLYQLREWTRYSVKQARHVFTISQASLLDIKEQYQKRQESISIVYPGVDIPANLDTELAFSTSVLSKFGLTEKKYIVSVGTIQPRKNMITAIKAYELLMQSNQIDPDCKLVFVGKAGWMTKEFDDAILSSQYKDKITVTGYVTDDEKQAILSKASCSFLVGFYEGFGIPVIESLIHGVRPVVANTSSLPEVAGGFAILIDPYNVQSVANGFSQALLHAPDPMERAQMREWAKQFSWEASGLKMISVLIEKFGRKS